MKLDISKYKAFFFDFDGVIVDSLDIKTEAFGDLFRQYGPDISRKVMEYHRNNGGVSRYEKFKHYYRNLLGKEINKTIMNRLDKRYSRLVVDKVIIAPYISGALPFIKKLNKERKLLFIISGTPQKEIRYILRLKKIGRLFKDAVGSPKTKTDNLKMLLVKYGINPQDALFFGDAKTDYEAARKNRLTFFALVNQKSKELIELSPKHRIRDFKEIKIKKEL